MLRQRVSGHFFNIYTGYKVTEKKNIDEYAKMDANDESLKRWKESLGISEGATAPAEGPQVSSDSLCSLHPLIDISVLL